MKAFAVERAKLGEEGPQAWVAFRWRTWTVWWLTLRFPAFGRRWREAPASRRQWLGHGYAIVTLGLNISGAVRPIFMLWLEGALEPGPRSITREYGIDEAIDVQLWGARPRPRTDLWSEQIHAAAKRLGILGALLMALPWLSIAALAGSGALGERQAQALVWPKAPPAAPSSCGKPVESLCMPEREP